jgi:hypothetical protein
MPIIKACAPYNVRPRGGISVSQTPQILIILFITEFYDKNINPSLSTRVRWGQDSANLVLDCDSWPLGRMLPVYIFISWKHFEMVPLITINDGWKIKSTNYWRQLCMCDGSYTVMLRYDITIAVINTDCSYERYIGKKDTNVHILDFIRVIIYWFEVGQNCYYSSRQVIWADKSCLCFIFPEHSAQKIWNTENFYQPIYYLPGAVIYVWYIHEYTYTLCLLQ